MSEKDLENLEEVEEQGPEQEPEQDDLFGKPNPDGLQIDLEALRMSQNYGSLGVTKRIIKIPCVKPNDQTWFMVHPSEEFSLTIRTLFLREDAEHYLVHPPLMDDLNDFLVLKRFYLYINRQGNMKFWPVKMEDEFGKLDSWNASGHEIAKSAKVGWLRMSSNRDLSSYEPHDPPKQYPAPEWPDLGFAEIVNIAFKNHYIATLEHPVVLKLAGEI